MALALGLVDRKSRTSLWNRLKVLIGDKSVDVWMLAEETEIDRIWAEVVAFWSTAASLKIPSSVTNAPGSRNELRFGRGD